ncbi:MAG TPA: nucleotidyltransferase family protein [Vicinamibacterales bacterium]|nr:nucleotidyltransferase family protein [Vicinamibacterales bacterium]
MNQSLSRDTDREKCLRDASERDRSRNAFYRDALLRLRRAQIPFLVGGAIAYTFYTHVERFTKDVDLFLRRDDVERAQSVFRAAGYHTARPFPHWLAKASSGPDFIDLIFSSGNGVVRVDDDWFGHAVDHEFLELPLKLCPPEEMIWSKAFVQERERFDGADVLHLFRELGPELDWARLLERFADHWRVLLAHIVLFGYVYPDSREKVPQWVTTTLVRQMTRERAEPDNPLCMGTLLSREQYLSDLRCLGYRDAREQPNGPMTREEIDIWTAAIDRGPDPIV